MWHPEGAKRAPTADDRSEPGAEHGARGSGRFAQHAGWLRGGFTTCSQLTIIGGHGAETAGQ
jgi:hypothetical protein